MRFSERAEGLEDIMKIQAKKVSIVVVGIIIGFVLLFA